MADHKDHLDEQDQSRPFLASTEAHQATLMKEVKKSRDHSEVAADDPAPMLPTILANTADTPPNPVAAATKDAIDDSQNAPTPKSTDNSVSSLAETHEVNHGQGSSFYPSSRRIVVGMAATLVAIVGFSAIWYSANQDIYTLGNSDSKQDSQSQAANDTDAPQSTKPATLGAETEAKTVTINFKQLPPLAQGYYHLWLKLDDKTSSLGQFSINDQGQAITTENQPFKPQLKNAPSEATLLVSIETTDNPSQPSTSILLSGQLKAGKAQLSFAAIDLSQASGVFTIAAPTDLSGDNQSSGIWFAKTDGHSLTGPGLSIPNSPEGWKYEAQLVFKDQIIATGRFSNPNDRDDFGVFTPNPDRTPSFPGEDYLQGAPSRLGVDFPANLTSGEWKVIISIEPDQSGSDPTGDDTFFLQPFTATINEGTENYKEQALTLDLAKFPTASVALN